MADYSQIAQALNPWQQAGQQILANPIQAQGYRQGINQDNPWKLALANMAQGLIGGAMGQYGATQAAEGQARARAQAQQAEMEMLKQKALIERENKIAEAQALNPLEIEKFKAQESYKMNNEVEKARQLNPLEIQKEEAITSMRALAEIRKHAANAGIDSQYAGANAGAQEEARLAAQAKYGALPNQGKMTGGVDKEEYFKGNNLLNVANALESAINKIESSRKTTGGILGSVVATKEKYMPGNSKEAKQYQSAQAILSQSFPNLFTAYRTPGIGSMAVQEMERFSGMMPTSTDTIEAMRQKVELIKRDAAAKMGGASQPMPQAQPGQSYPVRMPQPQEAPMAPPPQAAPPPPQSQPLNLQTMSDDDLLLRIQQRKAMQGGR